MRIPVDKAALPTEMAGAWHVNAHACSLPVQLDASQLVSTVFSMGPRPIVPGDRLRTQAGRFDVETVADTPDSVQIVLRTDAPGLDARLGITGEATSEKSFSVVLYTSVHPRSWVGRFYYRLIEPFHHILMEQLLIRRLRRRGRHLAAGFTRR